MQPAEPALHEAAGESLSPDPARAIRPSRDPSQMLDSTLHSRPPEVTPLARDVWSDTGEQAYGAPLSPVAGAPDHTEAQPMKGPESFTARETGEGPETESYPTGHERDDDPGDPVRYRHRPAPTTPEAVVPGEAPEPEGPSVIPHLHEKPPYRLQAGPDESHTRPSRSRIEPSRRSSGPDGLEDLPAERPNADQDTDHGEIDPEQVHETGPEQDRIDAEQGESDVPVSQRRRRGRSSSVRTHAAPPTDATVPDHAGPHTPGQEGRNLVFGTGELEQETEPLEPAASSRAERPGTRHDEPGME